MTSPESKKQGDQHEEQELLDVEKTQVRRYQVETMLQLTDFFACAPKINGELLRAGAVFSTSPALAMRLCADLYNDDELTSMICTRPLPEGHVLRRTIISKLREQRMMILGDVEEHQTHVSEQPELPTNSGSAVYCKSCQMWLNGPTQFEDHLVGNKHKKNVKSAVSRAIMAQEYGVAVLLSL